MNTELALTIVSALGGSAMQAPKVSAVSGGDSHAAHQLALGTERVFVKTNAARYADAFRSEAHALATIAASATVRVPQVLGMGCSDDVAWLALSWLDLAPLGSVAARTLGEQLAALHQHGADAFGWHERNWIGGSVQTNSWTANWTEFWFEQRLAPQLTLLRQRDLALAQTVERTAQAIRLRLSTHQPPVSLLHGDLWGGNAACDASDGQPVIFDPASYYGDRETDLAMTRLFGRLPQPFYDAYASTWPLPAELEPRCAIYNLYHALNHVNLFGPAYADLVRQCCQDIGSA